jgi:long-chain acyl-CoA synthetase
VAEYTADAGVREVVTLAPLAALLPDGVEALPPERLAREGEPLRELPPPAEDAVLIYTAAVDGWGRGARITRANLLANLRSTVEAMGMTTEDRILAVLPLIHLFGLTVTLNAPLSVGAKVILVERFHPARLLDALEPSGATVISGVPGMFAAMVAVAERRGVPSHNLRLAICGGAPLPSAVAEGWERVFRIPLREGYGLTEAGPVCLFNRFDRPNRIGTLGFPFPGVEVALRAADGAECAPGATGEICVAGANVFPGYLGDAGRRARDFHGDALRTGDLGRMEPDGRVVFVGIRKAMFTRNGFNIYPRELERVLTEDPGIAEARVTPIPDPARENEIALRVRAAPGAALSEDDVRALCRERLAAYKQPSVVILEDG